MPHRLKLSNRSDISVFRALDMLRLANEREAQGIDLVRMGAGQPCFGAPQDALDYAIEKIKTDPAQGYTEAMGMPALRERISTYYKTYYGVTAKPENITITAGSSAGFILTFLAAFDVGDKVAVTTPTYPAYRNILKALGLECIEIEALAKNDYQPTRALLEKHAGALDGLILNSPSNPAGTMIDDAELEKISQWCDENGVRLISDEAYHGITYKEKAQTALAYSDSAIILNTFSKYFAMTGWRLGWCIVPDDMRERMKKLSESLFVSAPTLSQHVAYKVFDHIDVLDEYVAAYAKNREILLEELPKAGITDITNAAGAFYVYADIHPMSNDSEQFCAQMMDEAHVSTTPGTDFDLTRGHKGIRICYAESEEKIVEACKRLQAWKR